jgi:hypothetical protein
MCKKAHLKKSATHCKALYLISLKRAAMSVPVSLFMKSLLYCKTLIELSWPNNAQVPAHENLYTQMGVYKLSKLQTCQCIVVTLSLGVLSSPIPSFSGIRESKDNFIKSQYEMLKLSIYFILCTRFETNSSCTLRSSENIL